MEFSFAERFDNMSGSAVRAIFNLLKDPNIISFGGGNPAGEYFPGDALSEIAAKLIKERPEVMLQYGQTEGYAPLREEIANMYNVSTDNVLITVGAMQAVDLIGKAMLDKGDCVLVENPTFIGTLQTFKMYQPKFKAVLTDDEGIIISDLEAKIKEYKPKLLYLVPNFQNPTGITTTLERRKAVSDLASKYNVLVIEDDPYGRLRYEGSALPSIFSLNKTGSVVYLTSFSKTISPGLRVGAAIGDSELIGKMTIGAQTETVHCSVLNQAMVYEFIRSGQHEPHIEKMCKLYKARRDNMLTAIKEYMPREVTYTHPEGGLFLWCTLPEGIDAMEVFKKAVEKKVAFVAGNSFYCENPAKNTFRLNFSFVNEEKATKGIKALAETIKEFI